MFALGIEVASVEIMMELLEWGNLVVRKKDYVQEEEAIDVEDED